jgi:hypothetical protein
MSEFSRWLTRKYPEYLLEQDVPMQQNAPAQSAVEILRQRLQKRAAAGQGGASTQQNQDAKAAAERLQQRMQQRQGGGSTPTQNQSDSSAGPALAFKLQTRVGLQIELDGENLKIESYSGDKDKFLFKGSAINSKNKDPKRFQQEIKETLETYLNFSANGNAKDFKIKIEPKKEKAFPSKPVMAGVETMAMQLIDRRGFKPILQVNPEYKSSIVYFIDENGKKTNFLDAIELFFKKDKNDLYKDFGVVERPNPNNVTFEGSITIKE